MLNMIEMSELWNFQHSLPEGRCKSLLNDLLTEYAEYIQCGTVEDCIQRREWMSYSIDDIRTYFNEIVKGLQEEVKTIRAEAVSPPKKKRGRPSERKVEKGEIKHD